MSTTSNLTYDVTGMTCTSCAAKVSDALDQVSGVTVTDVDLAAGAVTVALDPGDADREAVDTAARAAITAAGYQVA